MPYCDKHNREMLKSKFGEGEFWCPDCAKERKAKREQAGGVGNEKIMTALKTIANNQMAIVKKIDKLTDKLVDKSLELEDIENSIKKLVNCQEE